MEEFQYLRLGNSEFCCGKCHRGLWRDAQDAFKQNMASSLHTWPASFKFHQKSLRKTIVFVHISGSGTSKRNSVLTRTCSVVLPRACAMHSCSMLQKQLHNIFVWHTRHTSRYCTQGVNDNEWIPDARPHQALFWQ